MSDRRSSYRSRSRAGNNPTAGPLDWTERMRRSDRLSDSADVCEMEQSLASALVQSKALLKCLKGDLDADPAVSKATNTSHQRLTAASCSTQTRCETSTSGNTRHGPIQIVRKISL